MIKMEKLQKTEHAQLACGRFTISLGFLPIPSICMSVIHTKQNIHSFILAVPPLHFTFSSTSNITRLLPAVRKDCFKVSPIITLRHIIYVLM